MGGKIKKGIKKAVKTTGDVVTLGQADKMEEYTKGVTGYGAYSEAKKEAKRQKKILAAQEAERKKQEKLLADEQAKTDASTAERKGRMAKGRKGLLYGSATGVQKNTTLGG